MNFRFPIFLDVSGKRCVVTGEGFEVPGKVAALAEAGADVTYINARADERILALIQNGHVHWEAREFVPGDLEGCFLIICDTEQNRQIFEMAEAKSVLCNAVDDPQNCRFSFGSVHRQGELTIAISTNGWAPAVAVRLREWLGREIGPEYAEFLAILKEARPQIAERIASFEDRKKLWYELVDSEILDWLRKGEAERARSDVAARIERASRGPDPDPR